MTQKTPNIALLCSGGLDSALMFALAEERGVAFDTVLHVDMDQPSHNQEYLATVNLCHHYGFIPTRALVTGMSKGGMTNADRRPKDPCVIPHRNLILCSLAAHAGATEIWLGANADDERDYYDCRPAYLTEVASILRCPIRTPLARMSKSTIWKECCRLKVPTNNTWSCYTGNLEPCGQCASCVAVEEARDRWVTDELYGGDST